MKLLIKPFRAIYHFIKNHPGWSTLVLYFILVFISGYTGGSYDTSAQGWAVVILGITAFRLLRRNAHEKEEQEIKELIDYEAKKIALEQDKLAHPEKYE